MSDATDDALPTASDPPTAARAAATSFVVVATEGAEARAAAAADRLGAPFVRGEPPEGAVRLRIAPSGRASDLVGRDPDDGAVRIPLAALGAVRRGRDPLLHATLATEGPHPEVVDATAGLGADAFALAAAGCRVTALERHPALAFLLAEALALAANDPDLADAADRVTVVHADARAWLRRHPGVAPVVLLDPMYPRAAHGAGRRRRVGKEMRLFRDLVGDDPDADDLLGAARRAASRRVVVKRPRRAEPLAGVAPSGSIDGRTVRFDLYPPAPPA